MAVRKKIRIGKILDGADLKALEDHVLEQERLARRAETAQAKIRRQKNGGIFASRGNEALPSAFVKRRQRQETMGIAYGRQDDSAYAKTSYDKVKPIKTEQSPVESLMAMLGIKKYPRKESKDSLVSAAGRPIHSFDNEFTKLRSKVTNIETTQKGMAQIISKGQTLVGGAQALGTIVGIANLGLGAASRIPIVGIIVTAAVTASLAFWEKYTSQYRRGGTRDATKKILDSDVSRIGVQNENAIYSGTTVLISNPAKLQGLSGGHTLMTFVKACHGIISGIRGVTHDIVSLLEGFRQQGDCNR